MAKQYNASLTNIYSHSFTGNNLLNIQLIKSTPNSDKFTSKSNYFFMLTLAPGEKVDNNFGEQTRTYKFDKSINIKYSIQELFSLSFVMNQFSIGNGQSIGNYVKFSKSGSTSKRVTVWESSKVEKNQNGDYTKRIINLGVASADKFVFNFSVEDAHAFSLVLIYMANKALDLEFNRQSSQSFSQNPQVVYERKQEQHFTNNQAPSDDVANNFNTMMNNLPWGE